MTIIRCNNIKKHMCVGIAIVLLAGCTVLSSEKTVKMQTAKYHVAIIQAAGYLPGTEKPTGSDAITHATTKAVNTYMLTSNLVEELTVLGAEVKVINYSDCADLACLYPVEERGKKQDVDLVVFAGPSEYSKQQKKLLVLFPKLEEVVKRSPEIICSSLVPAWYPETKGQKALKHSDDSFKAAGARTVKGISLLTPRKGNPGVSKEEMKKALSTFADDLIAEVSKQKKKSEKHQI